MKGRESSAEYRVDFTNFTEGALGLGRGLLEADIPTIERLCGVVSSAVVRQHAAGKLPYLDLPDQDIRAILDFAQASLGRYDNVVVLGIGGSALGITAAATALLDPYPVGGIRKPQLHVFDNIDPFLFGRFCETCDFSKSIFVVISKSGTTAETMSQYLIVRHILTERGLPLRDHFVVITDPEKGELRAIARRDGLTAFPIHPGVGGRFSVLTPVGLVPAALVGMDIAGLLAGAHDYTAYALKNERNASSWLAAALFLLLRKGYTNHVMMPYSSRLRDVADWYRQLWAESLGKRTDRAGRIVETGATPIKALGVTDQHSQVQLYAEGPRDKAFIFVGVKDHGRTMPIPAPDDPKSGLKYLAGHSMNELIGAEMLGTMVALTDAGRPNCFIEIDAVTPRTIGTIFAMFEISVSYVGELLDIDAYDQPGVEAGKNAAYALMGRTGYEKEAERIRARLSGRPDLRLP
ncbi:MAG: glucose-6-phosphate isomerase [Candidatus Brocadiia bacterium]